jgi:hypothetical protein
VTRISVTSIVLLALALPAGAAASPEPPEPGTPPSLTGLERTSAVILPPYLRCRPSQLPRQTIFSFFVNQNASVTVVFRRVVAGGLSDGRGRLTRAAVTGKNRLRFAGVVRTAKGAHKRLPPGRYRAFFTSSNQFGSSPTSAVGIRIAQRQRRCR